MLLLLQCGRVNTNKMDLIYLYLLVDNEHWVWAKLYFTGIHKLIQKHYLFDTFTRVKNIYKARASMATFSFVKPSLSHADQLRVNPGRSNIVISACLTGHPS